MFVKFEAAPSVMEEVTFRHACHREAAREGAKSV